jgi:cysteine desulfurase
MLSVSSHKIHGPKGVGAVYIGKNIRIKPIIFGGGQESLIRSGTENVSGICGFGLATDLVFKAISENASKVLAIKQLLISELEKRVDKIKVISPENSSPYILNIAFEGVHAEVLLHHLEEKCIYVSTGSACSSRKNIHSHVLQALKIGQEYIEGAIRFSFSPFNTEDEMIKTAKEIERIVPKIRIKKRR